MLPTQLQRILQLIKHRLVELGWRMQRATEHGILEAIEYSRLKEPESISVDQAEKSPLLEVYVVGEQLLPVHLNPYVKLMMGLLKDKYYPPLVMFRSLLRYKKYIYWFSKGNNKGGWPNRPTETEPNAKDSNTELPKKVKWGRHPNEDDASSKVDNRNQDYGEKLVRQTLWGKAVDESPQNGNDKTKKDFNTPSQATIVGPKTIGNNRMQGPPVFESFVDQEDEITDKKQMSETDKYMELEALRQQRAWGVKRPTKQQLLKMVDIGADENPQARKPASTNNEEFDIEDCRLSLQQQRTQLLDVLKQLRKESGSEQQEKSLKKKSLIDVARNDHQLSLLAQRKFRKNMFLSQDNIDENVSIIKQQAIHLAKNEKIERDRESNQKQLKEEGRAGIDEVLGSALGETADSMGLDFQNFLRSQPADPPQVAPTKRKWLSDLKPIRNKQTIRLLDGKVATEYYKQVESKSEEALKRSKYQLNEFFRGEEGVDILPVADRFKVKMRRLSQQIQELAKRVRVSDKEDEYEQPEEMKNDPRAISENINHIKKLREKENHFQDLQNLQRVIKNYPGSPRGPDPQDDPQNYIEYLIANVPKYMHEQLGLTQKEEKEDVVVQEESGKGGLIKSATPEDYLSEPFNIEDITNVDNQQDAIDAVNDVLPEFDEMPTLPAYQHLSYQENWDVYINWSNFSNYYFMSTLQPFLNDVIDQVTDGINESRVPFEPVKPASLYYYYKTLPKDIQESPAVKDIYLGLEYSCPDKTFREKERALNLAAYMTLPLDPVSEEMIAEHMEEDRYEPTPADVERVNTMKPEFTYDIQDFIKETKEEQLRGENKLKEGIENEEYPLPPPFRSEPEDVANLPIDFYDNEDGFWDDYIKHKTQLYEATPLMKHRPYLKH